MGAALALSERGRGQTYPNPNVGCVIVRRGRVVGRGWTAPGGRPHAEAMALKEAGEAARGATVYTTLEPCAHQSARGPTCTELLIEAGVARVVSALIDPDPRTCGHGHERLRQAGIAVTAGTLATEAERAMAPFLARHRSGRPFVTLKLAASLDGCIALANGTSRWITGTTARAHVHGERARHEAILIGRGTWEADEPRLDVRLPGLEARSPARYLLSSTTRAEPTGFGLLTAPEQIATLPHDSLLVEGGAATAAAFVAADLVDRLLLYTAPILIGNGRRALGEIGLADLTGAHGHWRLYNQRRLGSDGLQVYERVR